MANSRARSNITAYRLSAQTLSRAEVEPLISNEDEQILSENKSVSPDNSVIACRVNIRTPAWAI